MKSQVFRSTDHVSAEIKIFESFTQFGEVYSMTFISFRLQANLIILKA